MSLSQPSVDFFIPMPWSCAACPCLHQHPKGTCSTGSLSAEMPQAPMDPILSLPNSKKRRKCKTSSYTLPLAGATFFPLEALLDLAQTSCACRGRDADALAPPTYPMHLFSVKYGDVRGHSRHGVMIAPFLSGCLLLALLCSSSEATSNRKHQKVAIQKLCPAALCGSPPAHERAGIYSQLRERWAPSRLMLCGETNEISSFLSLAN